MPRAREVARAVGRGAREVGAGFVEGAEIPTTPRAWGVAAGKAIRGSETHPRTGRTMMKSDKSRFLDLFYSYYPEEYMGIYYDNISTIQLYSDIQVYYPGQFVFIMEKFN